MLALMLPLLAPSLMVGAPASRRAVRLHMRASVGAVLSSTLSNYIGTSGKKAVLFCLGNELPEIQGGLASEAAELGYELVALCPDQVAPSDTSVRIVVAPPASVVGSTASRELDVSLFAESMLTTFVVDDTGTIRATCGLPSRAEHPPFALAECVRCVSDTEYLQDEAPAEPIAKADRLKTAEESEKEQLKEQRASELGLPIAEVSIGLEWNSAEKMFPFFFSDSETQRGDSKLADFLDDNPAVTPALLLAFLAFSFIDDPSRFGFITGALGGTTSPQ